MHSREMFRHFGERMSDEFRRMAKHRRGRGFGPFAEAVMGGAAFDRSGFRTGRKLASDDLQLLLLALIEEKPSHGYDLIKMLEARSGGFYVPSPGMVYPALTYLEEAGYATVAPEGTKKLYSISPEGRAHLEQNRAGVEALLSQLARIGDRMGDVRRAFADRDEDDDGSELHQARRELRRALRERRHVSAEETRRIAEILRRAAAAILGRQ